MHTLKLKETILHEPADADADAEQLAEDRWKNADCYAELIRLINDKSLSLIGHEAADDGRKVLRIMKEHYSGKRTDYLIRAENIITALRDAGETMSDGLTITMILRGLPDSFNPQAVHITQNEDNVTFTDLRGGGENEKNRNCR